MTVNPDVTAFFDEETYTASYVIADPETGTAAILDPVMDFDLASGSISSESADRIIDFVETGGLQVEWILETHVHADHLTAAPYLKERIGGRISIGNQVRRIQEFFGDFYNLGSDFRPDGGEFDHLFARNESFSIGAMKAQVIATPGHTPACVCYHIGDAVFVGDTLFMPDYGTARCDFPGGDARVLYRSIQEILSLPDATRMFLCHDYKAPDRDWFAWETTVAEQKRGNIHLQAAPDEEAFVRMREGRDANLGVPKLMLPAIQVNMCAGNLPEKAANGITYLKYPLNQF